MTLIASLDQDIQNPDSEIEGIVYLKLLIINILFLKIDINLFELSHNLCIRVLSHGVQE